MDHPDDPVNISWSKPGEIASEPADLIAVIVRDENDEPSGILEKWGPDTWIYADADSLRQTN